MSKYDRGQFSGIGTDLFIKKNSPGQHIGKGYTIEIFLNGVKQEEILKRTKKDVIDFLKETKKTYNTNRAFENASQFHITYKSKEERGEESIPDFKEEEHMASIESTLLKQASEIETLMTRLMSPELPVKIRQAADEILNTNDMPDPSPQMDSMPVTPESVAKMLTDKLVAYVGSKPDVQVDELYNSIKHWISEVKKKLNEYEKGSNQKIDRAKILDIFRKNVFDGKLPVPPQQQQLIQEVLSKKASIHTNTEKYDDLAKVSERINSNSDNPGNSVIIRETVSSMDPEEARKQIKALDEKDKNFSETIVDKAIKDMEKDLKLASIYYDYIQKEKKAFFKHASTVKGTHALESVYSSYISDKDMTLDDAQYLWDKVQEDISGADKFACILSDCIHFLLPVHSIDKTAVINLKHKLPSIIPSITQQLLPIIQDYVMVYNSEDAPDKPAKLQEYQGALTIAFDSVLQKLYQLSFALYDKNYRSTQGIRAVDDFVRRTGDRDPANDLEIIKDMVPLIVRDAVAPEYTAIATEFVDKSLSAAYTGLAKDTIVNKYLIAHGLSF